MYNTNHALMMGLAYTFSSNRCGLQCERFESTAAAATAVKKSINHSNNNDQRQAINHTRLDCITAKYSGCIKFSPNENHNPNYK